MDSGTLYAEQLMNEFEARFATADFSNRVSYFSGLKNRVLRGGRRSRRDSSAQRPSAPPTFLW